QRGERLQADLHRQGVVVVLHPTERIGAGEGGGGYAVGVGEEIALPTGDDIIGDQWGAGAPRRRGRGLPHTHRDERRLPLRDAEGGERPGQLPAVVADVVQLPLPQTAVGAQRQVAGTDTAEGHGHVPTLGVRDRPWLVTGAHRSPSSWLTSARPS